MTKWLLAAAMTLGACVSSTITSDAYAPNAQYGADIGACTNGACDRLCTRLFQLDPDDAIDSCAITSCDTSGAHVHVTYEVASDDDGYASGDDDGDDSSDDGSDDDGSDDGTDDSGRRAHRQATQATVNDPVR